MTIRGEGLAATLSQHLIDRINANARIELPPHTEVLRLECDRAGLRKVGWLTAAKGEEVAVATCALRLFVGADPNTGRLAGCPIELDTHGFVCTGRAIAEAALVAGGWHDGGRPDSLECWEPGVFAIGDGRAESVKRVATAVREGADVISQVHRCLSAQLASVSASASASAQAASTASGTASAAVRGVPTA
jgi:thioredoxin reductase (NADPH)